MYCVVGVWGFGDLEQNQPVSQSASQPVSHHIEWWQPVSRIFRGEISHIKEEMRLPKGIAYWQQCDDYQINRMFGFWQ